MLHLGTNLGIPVVSLEGTSDVVDLVGEVYEYLVSGKYGDGASREKKQMIRKKP